MKKTLILITAMILIFAGCKKDDVIEASKVEIINLNLEKGTDYFKVIGEYDYPEELADINLYLSEKEDMNGAKTYKCNLEGKTFSVEVDGLKDGTKYYYQLEYYNGYEKIINEKSEFVTEKMKKPTVTTANVTNVTETTATSGGNVTDDGGSTITARGVCWSTSQNPTINDNKTTDGNGTGGFNSSLTNLIPNTTYYVRAYATNSAGTGYGNEVSFTTLQNVGLPTVTTTNITDITQTTATSGGNVTDDGGATITAHGVCWNTSQNPTINDNKTTDSGGIGGFNSSLTNLTPNTKYYVRAYATNIAGTGYGNEVSFTTMEDGGIINGYEYLDLGLPSGLKWATCNVGADSPEDYGNYYAWGEVTTKSTYDTGNSETYGLSISQLQSQGYIDGEGNLTPSHDAATANWGGSWRMPTNAELQELVDNCTWEWTTQNGVNGYKVTGPYGNHIFLPAAGRYVSSLYGAGEDGNYWSSTTHEGYSNNACSFHIFGGGLNIQYGYRPDGCSVRPVTE